MKFRIYRYNPDTDTAPYMQDYELDIRQMTARRPRCCWMRCCCSRQQDDSLSACANPAAKACADRMR